MSRHRSKERLLAFAVELSVSRRLLEAGDLDRAFAHAERAHILGQPWARRHTAAHWMMLQIGRRRRDRREVWGQTIRLAAAGLLSILQRAPNGNTGGANVHPERPMPVPADLEVLCTPQNGERDRARS